MYNINRSAIKIQLRYRKYLTIRKKIPKKMFIELIEEQTKKEFNLNIWKDSPYKNIVKLQVNNVGLTGETFIQNLCNKYGIDAYIDGQKTKKIGGGNGDGEILNKTVEVKTARLCSNEITFQHELAEKPWIADMMIFIDVAPFDIYLTIFKNFSEEHYKSSNKCIPYFPTKIITHRKKEGAFKLDTTININKKNVEEGHTFVINDNFNPTQFKKFILSKFE